MKILSTAPFDKEWLDQLSQVAEVVNGPQEESRLLMPAEFADLVQKEEPDTLIVELNPVNTTVLKASNRLRLLAVCRSGLDNIDLEYATQRNIAVINSPGRNATGVAEFTIGLMISLARHLVESTIQVKDRRWNDTLEAWNRYMGMELSEKTAGIIGLGAIGREVTARLRAFKMQILAFDPYVTEQTASKVGARKVTLEHLLQASDFVLIHAPVTAETRGMIDARRIGFMKRSAFLINMARAALIDETALLKALKVHQIAGAALDVHSQEPLPIDSPWLDLDNVLLTPHIAGCTKEIIRNHSRMIGEDILRFSRGERPLRLVNPSVWEGQNDGHSIPGF